MSLFPAYSSKNEENEGETSKGMISTSDSQSWLANTSFIPAIENSADKEPESTEVETRKRSRTEKESHHKHKKHKKHKKSSSKHDEEIMFNNYSAKRKSPEEAKDDFFVDKKKNYRYSGMTRLTGPDVPRYSRKLYFKPLGFKYVSSGHKAKKRKRYFKLKSKVEENFEETSSWNHDVQAELKQTTEQLNKKLAQDPNDIATWLKLVRIQPTLLSLAPRPSCNLSYNERRTVIDKQLSILDRALRSNPSSSQLLKERYGLASMVIPADSVATELKQRLELQPLLLEGWLELARVERSHLASCSVPGVTAVFSQAMEAVHGRRRKEPILVVEATLLGLVLACGQFLQEAGLMEQVWTLLRLYTETSLPEDKDPVYVNQLQTSINKNIAAWEDVSGKNEDTLLATGLPSTELWLRIERLRESAHFLPAPDCVWAKEGDPQRLVFPEDLTSLSFPITQRSLSLKLVVTVLLVLGVPPLPCSHVSMAVLSQGVAIPNLALLAASWPSIIADIQLDAGWLGDITKDVLTGTGLLLNPGEGGRLYRQLLALMFIKLSGKLQEVEERSLLAWWLRSETLLARIMPDKEASKFARSTAKNILKRPENRGNSILFKEFALLEAAVSKDISNAEKIIIPIIQTSQGDIVGQGDKVSIYLTLAEIWASQQRWNDVMSLLVNMVDCSCKLNSKPSCMNIKNVLNKYQDVTDHYLNTQNGDMECSVLDILNPDFLSTWISCHAWLLLSTENIYASCAMLEAVLTKISNCVPQTLLSRQKENIYTTYIKLLELNSKQNPGGTSLLRKILTQALNEFPNNISLLSVQCNLSLPLGKDTKIIQQDELIGNIIRVIALEQRNADYETCSPRVLSQYEKLITHFESRHCPLVWRLYLRYVGLRASPGKIKSIFYKSLEDCPWVKALYLQGVSLLPEECDNIQDLLVEKELRLHLAPEELQILRT